MRLQSFIEKIWYSNNPLCWFLWPLSIPFYLIVQLKRQLYKRGIISVSEFNKPVILVGNINVGGTGKTPFIQALVGLLDHKGLKVGVVSRGYQAGIEKFPHLVNDHDTALSVGDEAFMQYSKLAIPCVIDPNRARAVRYLIEQTDVDIVISDDGLQHYKMARDVEIVLFDQERKFGNKLVLPFGPLREPISRLNSVDIVIQNGNEHNQYTEYTAELKATSVVNLRSRAELAIDDLDNLNNEKQLHAVAGIGNPQRFFRTLAEASTTSINSHSLSSGDEGSFTQHSFADHHSFTSQDFIDYEKELVIMTEKDAVKCFDFAKDSWYYLNVKMVFNQLLHDKLNQCIDNLLKK
jgi:tetraacyldisaccharide 4'-kinase